MALIVLTTVLLTIQYSFFDHSLRHLLVVLPMMLWEFSAWIGDAVRQVVQGPRKIRGDRSGLLRDLGSVIFLPAAAAVVIVFLFPCSLPGWEFAAGEAVSFAARTERQIESTRRTPPGILFVDTSAVPWFIDRPVVWSPTEKSTRKRICEFMGQPEATP
jgi:hypothetical protein